MNHSIVSSAYSGFLYSPFCWFVTPPTEADWKSSNNNAIFKTVYETTMPCGIRVKIRRDGFILFDFNNWRPASYVIIPGYESIPNKVVPAKVIQQELLAENRAQRRSEVINAFLLTLNSTYTRNGRFGLPLAEPVLAKNIVTTWTFSGLSYNPFEYGSDSSQIYAKYVIDSLNARNKAPTLNATTIDFQALKNSLSILNEIILYSDIDMISLTNLLYWSNNRYRENLYPESLILSWSICESLVNAAWYQLLIRIKNSSANNPRMSTKRITQLQGTGFNSFAKIEILELNGVIPHELYELLSSVRKARNKWLHRLHPVSPEEAERGLRAAEYLVAHITGLQINPNVCRTAPGTGGCPEKFYEFPAS